MKLLIKDWKAPRSCPSKAKLSPAANQSQTDKQKIIELQTWADNAVNISQADKLS